MQCSSHVINSHSCVSWCLCGTKLCFCYGVHHYLQNGVFYFDFRIVQVKFYAYIFLRWCGNWKIRSFYSISGFLERVTETFFSFNYEVNFMSLARILKIRFRDTLLLLVMNLLEKFWDISESQTKLISFMFNRIFVTSHGFHQILSFSCSTLSVPVSA